MRPIFTRTLWIMAAACPIIFLVSSAREAKDYPVEAGPAKFLRDHDQAMAKAKKTGKPVFAFFQEVPG